MRTLSALELRKKLGQVLDAASSGDRIIIERDRRPLAMLVSYEEGLRLVESDDERLRRALAALDRLDAFRERMSRKYPPEADEPDAVTLIRQDRSRDDPGFDRESIRPPKRTKP